MAKSIYLLSIALAGCALAQEHPNLDVKMGLWEMTTVVKLNGMASMMDTSKMTPDMKEKMENSMKASQARMAQPHTTRTCITKEKIDKDTMFNPDQAQSSCKRTVVTNSRSTLEVKLECVNEKRPMTGMMHFEATSRESVKGIFKMSSGAMTSESTMAGKWISDSCGDVK